MAAVQGRGPHQTRVWIALGLFCASPRQSLLGVVSVALVSVLSVAVTERRLIWVLGVGGCSVVNGMRSFFC